MPNSPNAIHDTRFLVIDRDVAVLVSVESYLRMNAARVVHTVESVLPGLGILKDTHVGVSCIICAHDVTPISGLEFLKNIRSGKYGTAPALRAVNFIMLTAHREMALVEAAVKLDVNGYITKPFDHASFTRGVHKGLAHHVGPKPASDYQDVDVSKAVRLPVWLSPP